jgi:hypothetical protein
MDWNAICDALEAKAETVPGINAFSEVPDSLPTIGFYVGEIDVELNTTMRGKRTPGGPRRGSDQANITCRILVARMDDKQALRKLRAFMGGQGATSIVDALELDRTLNGTVDDSRCVSMRGNRLFDVGATKYYGVELDLFVIGDA